MARWHFLLTLPFCGIAHVHSKATVVLESAHHLPPGWKLDRAAADHEPVELSVALRQPKLQDLETRLWQSSQSGQYLSKSQLETYQKPHGNAVGAVKEWLRTRGVDDARESGAWLRFNASVGAVRSIFEANMSYYSYDAAAPVLRTQSYTIPMSLGEYIDFVYPLMQFMAPALRSRVRPESLVSTRDAPPLAPPRDKNATNCAAVVVTPACIKQLYNWKYTAPAADSPVRFGIAGFLDEYINFEDVANFTQEFAPDIVGLQPPYNFTVELIANGTNPQFPRWRAGMEASLDIQYALALAYPARITYYSTGGRGVKLDSNGIPYPTESSDNEPYLELLQHLLGLPDDKVPHVLSMSYADDEQSVPRAYALRVCDMLLQLTARGVSILAASGDGGSAGVGREACVSNDGAGRRMLLPTFPASCPWVTAVGATSNEPLTAAAEYSSGGFSNYFARPPWQEAAVAAYVAALNGSKAEFYNASGRGIPDLAAVGSEFRVIWGNGPANLMGTSASAPLVASMLAVVNDARLRAGKGVAGWLNPALYSSRLRAVLEDVTDGVSTRCKFNATDAEPGWPALPGWDAVTGLGVPSDFSAFLDGLVHTNST